MNLHSNSQTQTLQIGVSTLYSETKHILAILNRY